MHADACSQPCPCRSWSFPYCARNASSMACTNSLRNIALKLSSLTPMRVSAALNCHSNCVFARSKKNSKNELSCIETLYFKFAHNVAFSLACDTRKRTVAMRKSFTSHGGATWHMQTNTIKPRVQFSTPPFPFVVRYQREGKKNSCCAA